jgi:selenoprotein W-related protein
VSHSSFCCAVVAHKQRLCSTNKQQLTGQRSVHWLTMTSKISNANDLLLPVILILIILTSVMGLVSGFQPLPWWQGSPQKTGFSTMTERYSPLFVLKDETGTLFRTVEQGKAKYHHVSIEYCTGCRWMLKSFWLAQELLSTFGKSELDAITVKPSFDTQGKFVIYLSKIDDKQSTTQPIDDTLQLWDRQERGGFPTPKDLKQLVRDYVNPDMYLGHSDTKLRQNDHDGERIDMQVRESALQKESASDTIIQVPLNSNFTPSPSITIHYCTGCQWLLRAAYFGQELLTTFGGGEIKSVTLVPSKPPEKGGRFVSFHNCCVYQGERGGGALCKH